MMTTIKENEALFAQGKIEEAEKCFLDLLKNDLKNPEILNNLGVIQHAKSNLQKAEGYFLKAIEAKEDYLDPLLNLVDLYEEARRWEEAALQLEKCTAMDDRDPNLYNRIGMIYLEMGNTEKAKAVLARSLELNPDQEIVRDSLKALERKDETPRIELSEKPLDILFVQEAAAIRNYKMAKALRSRGHKVSLAYTKARPSQMYKDLSDDVYNECIQLQSHRHLWDISKNYDIVHCHNEPDILTVAALAGDAPVVHDTADLISLRAGGDPNLTYFEGVANRGATGRVYSTPYQLEEAKKLYGIEGPSLIFYNYASESDLPQKFLPKLSDQDGNIHIVYEGGIGGNTHRDFRSLFVDLANQGIHVHIYPAFFNQDIAQYFLTFENVHHNNPLSPKQIIEEMTQYDFGIIPFNLKKGNKRFLDSTIANKLFEYIAAGLPVIASPLKSYIDYFIRNPVGITFNNSQDIIHNIPKLKEIVATTDLAKHVFTYEKVIENLISFYHEIIGLWFPKDRVCEDKNNGNGNDQHVKQKAETSIRNHNKSLQIRFNTLRPGIDYPIDASYCKTPNKKKLFHFRKIQKLMNRYPLARSINDIVIEKYQTSSINVDLGLKQAEIQHHFVLILNSLLGNFAGVTDEFISELENRGHKVTAYLTNIPVSHKYNDLPIITNILRQMLKKEYDTLGADVLFAVHGGRYWTKEMVEDAKQAGMKTIYFPYDDIMLFDLISCHLAPHFHHVFSYPSAKQVYKQELGIDIIDFLGYTHLSHELGRDPVSAEKARFNSDIILTGSLYGPRKGPRYEYLKGFYQKGLNVHYYGYTDNLKDDLFNKIYKGRVNSHDHENILYRSSKIGFCLSQQLQNCEYNCYGITKSTVLGHIWCASAAGILVLCDDVDDLRIAYNPDEVVVYEDLNDAVEKAEYYTHHHEERVLIAQKGKKRCLSDHTICNRVKQIEAIIDVKHQ